MSDELLIPAFEEYLFPFEKNAKDASTHEVETWRRNFRENPMRGFLGMEIRRLIREQHKNLETVEPENLKKIQGKIEGLRMAHGLLQRDK